MDDSGKRTVCRPVDAPCDELCDTSAVLGCSAGLPCDGSAVALLSALGGARDAALLDASFASMRVC